MNVNMQISDDELIRRCNKGDQDACRMIYEQYAPTMMGLCMRYASSKEDAQDLLHDGFVKVFSNMKRLKEGANLGGWIRTVMVNTAISHTRKIAMTTSLEDIDEVVVTTDYSNLDVEYLISIIQQLPEKYRVVFNLHEVEGFHFSEIAQLLDIEESSVRSILFRARNKIIEKLENDER